MEVLLSKEQIRTFAAVLNLAEIKAYIEANREDYERFLADERTKPETFTPKKRVSRKGVS